MTARFAPIAAGRMRPHSVTVAKRAAIKAHVCRCRSEGKGLGDYLDPNTLGDDGPAVVGPPARPSPSDSSGNGFLRNILSAAGDVAGVFLGAAANRALDRIAHGNTPSAASPSATSPTIAPIPSGTGGMAIPYYQSILPQTPIARLAPQPQPAQAAALNPTTLMIGAGIVLAIVALSRR